MPSAPIALAEASDIHRTIGRAQADTPSLALFVKEQCYRRAMRPDEEIHDSFAFDGTRSCLLQHTVGNLGPDQRRLIPDAAQCSAPEPNGRQWLTPKEMGDDVLLPRTSLEQARSKFEDASGRARGLKAECVAVQSCEETGGDIRNDRLFKFLQPMTEPYRVLVT